MITILFQSMFESMMKNIIVVDDDDDQWFVEFGDM